MHIRVIGSNMETGAALTQYVEEHLTKAVNKHFDGALNADVHFSKEGIIFKTIILVNEGVKGGIKIKSDAQAGDVYACFNEACDKVTKQLRRYKRKIKNYRRQAGGLKSVGDDYKSFDAMKYVIPQHYVLEDAEEEIQEQKEESLNVIGEKNIEVETLSVSEAIMKMDLADLPALVFNNKENGRINVVYQRRDGNISWVDPKNG